MRLRLAEILGRLGPLTDTLVAFDPGETTGVVEVVDGKLEMATNLNEEQMMHRLNGNSPWLTFPEWVYEKFLLYPNKMNQQGYSEMLPSQMIGMIRLSAQRYKIPVSSYTAAEAKNLVQDDVLEYYGYLTSNRHQRDAARHALLHQLKRKGLKA